MKKITIMLVLFLLFSIVSLSNFAFSQTIYIDPTSIEIKKLGTIEYPFKSWFSVTWETGNNYLQKRGTTFKGIIQISASGTQSDPIVLGAYGEGVNPVLYGGERLNGSWNNEGNGVWSISVPAGTGHAFFVDGNLLLNARNEKCLDGSWFRGGGPTIFFRPLQGTPSDYNIEYGVFQTAITSIDNSYITIQNLDVTKFNCSGNGYTAIYFQGKNQQIKGIKITHCNIYDCENKGITIDNALVPEVSYCKVFNLGRCGIYFRRDTANGIIHHNIVYSCGKKARSGGGDVGGIAIGSKGNCVGNIVEYNDVYDIGNSVINSALDCAVASWGETSQTETIYRYNYIHDNACGAINTGNHGGGSQVYHNLIVRNGGTNPKIKNGGIYVSNASLDVDHVKVYHNTCVDNIAPIQQGGIWAYNSSLGLEVYNNVIADTHNGPALMIPDKIKSFSADYNCYYGGDKTIISYKSKNFTSDSFQQYIDLTSQEKNSKIANPSFNGQGDYTLQQDSPCLNSGADMDKLATTFSLSSILSGYFAQPHNLRFIDSQQ